MRYYKQIIDDYIVAIGVGESGTEITAAEYDMIQAVIEDKPPRTSTTDYRLRTDLTWEEVEVEPEPEPDPDPEELLSIMLGGDING